MENTFDYIERYFDGSLTEEESAAFEKRRLDDRKFDYEVRLYQKTKEIISENARIRMKRKLDHLGNNQAAVDIVDTFVKYRFIRKHWLSLAASVIAISALAYFALNGFFNQGRVDTLAGLYDNYFEKPGIDQVITRSGEEDDNETVWNSALSDYNNSDYSRAVNQFETLLISPSFNLKSAAHFYLGICYLNMDQADSAVRHLNYVSASSSFSDEAHWYLALSHIKNGNPDGAKAILNKIKERIRHPYQKQSAKLVRELRKLEKQAKNE